MILNIKQKYIPNKLKLYITNDIYVTVYQSVRLLLSI